jgi:hypothetical protein
MIEPPLLVVRYQNHVRHDPTVELRSATLMVSSGRVWYLDGFVNLRRYRPSGLVCRYRPSSLRVSLREEKLPVAPIYFREVK